MLKLFTSDAAGGSGGQAYQLFQQHSLHWEDLVCSQIQVILHPAAHPVARVRKHVFRLLFLNLLAQSVQAEQQNFKDSGSNSKQIIISYTTDKLYQRSRYFCMKKPVDKQSFVKMLQRNQQHTIPSITKKKEK